jgi:phage portal protein BeeE
MVAAFGASYSAAVDAFYKAEDGEDDDGGFPQARNGDREDPTEPGQQTGPKTIEEMEEALADPKSLFWDPFAVIDALGYKDKPSSLTYHTLNAMVWRMPIIHSIILTRLNQVANFAYPQEDKFNPGFRIRLADPKAIPTPETEAKGKLLENFILTTGVTENPEGRDNFETFLRKTMRDSLTYDQMCFEIVPSRSGIPAEFYAVDAATVRIADTTKLRFDEDDVEAARFVQVYDGLVVAEYTQREMCFGVRNPTTNIKNQNYGQSELEMLVSTITSLLWAWDYNQKFFSQGTSAKGIINFKGAIPDKQLRSFRRFWYSQVAGVENSFKIPVTNADELQWVNMQQSNRDMEFSAWFDFLIKVATGVYGMDSMEVNFKYGDTGSQSMFESSNASKLTASKDKGLKPLLRFVQNKINTHIIHPIDPDFRFEFVGLEAATPGDLADLQTKQVKTYKTVDEIRAEEDLEPLPDGNGEVILDPVWNQFQMMKQQADMGVGDFAEEDGEEDDPFGNLQNDLDEGDDGESEGDGEQAKDGGSDKGGDTDEAAKPAKPAEAPKDKKKNPFGKSLRKGRKPIIVDFEI